MVMELLGKSLEDFKVEHKTFSIKTVAMLGIEIINIFQYLHDNDLIHIDIKPDNFAVGYNDKSRIYIFDFGLSKRYRSIATGAHNPMMKENKLTGTARYASINALLGFEQSRRDDLEAMSYMLMYFLRDKLPWQGLVVKQKENRYAKILEKKQSFPLSMLCEGFPRQFEELISYTRNLLYEENPNYDYMKNLMLSVLKNIDAQPDLHFDWFTEEDILKLEQKHSISQTGDDNDNNNVENRDTQRDNTEAMDPKALNQPVDLNVEDKKKRNNCCCVIV